MKPCLNSSSSSSSQSLQSLLHCWMRGFGSPQAFYTGRTQLDIKTLVTKCPWLNWLNRYILHTHAQEGHESATKSPKTWWWWMDPLQSISTPPIHDEWCALKEGVAAGKVMGTGQLVARMYIYVYVYVYIRYIHTYIHKCIHKTHKCIHTTYTYVYTYNTYTAFIHAYDT